MSINKILKEEILMQKSDPDFDWHQAILDIGYTRWQNSENINNYEDMINFMSSNYGDFSALMILVGKYNQQVCNGGHIQYYNNKYCGSDEAGLPSIDLHLHKLMLKLFSKYILSSKELNQDDLNCVNEAYTIMEDFLKVDIDTEAYIEEEEFDNDGSYVSEYENPDFGYMSDHGHTMCDRLDHSYYLINDKLLEIYNSLIKAMIDEN
jgi:hypothetical protein